MKDNSNDFMVDIVNSEPADTTNEVMLAGFVVLLIIAGLVWWFRRK